MSQSLYSYGQGMTLDTRVLNITKRTARLESLGEISRSRTQSSLITPPRYRNSGTISIDMPVGNTASHIACDPFTAVTFMLWTLILANLVIIDVKQQREVVNNAAYSANSDGSLRRRRGETRRPIPNQSAANMITTCYTGYTRKRAS